MIFTIQKNTEVQNDIDMNFQKWLTFGFTSKPYLGIII